MAWNNITGKPSTFNPSSHTHDDRYYTESEINSKLSGMTRMLQTVWGTSLSIPSSPHGLVLYSQRSIYLIWVAGNAGAYQLNTKLVTGNDELNLSVNANNGTVTVSAKNSANGTITYIGK